MNIIKSIYFTIFCIFSISMRLCAMDAAEGDDRGLKRLREDREQSSRKSRKLNSDENLCNTIPPLHKACADGDKAAIVALINDNINLDDPDIYGKTALHTAAINGHHEIIRLLLDHFANVTIQDAQGNTPLHLACIENNSNLVSILLDNDFSTLYIKNFDNKYPFETAIDSGHKVLAQFLTQKIAVADSYWQNRLAEDPFLLHKMYEDNNNIATMRQLIHAGGDVNARWLHNNHFANDGRSEESESIKDDQDYFGFTPLHVAAKFNCLLCLKLLIAEGAHIDSTVINVYDEVNNFEGMTPLHIATRYNHHEIVSFLIDSGADVNKEFEGGKKYSGTALHIAALKGESLQIANLLLKNNARINAKIDEISEYYPGATPLHIAARYNNIPVTQLLITQEALLNEQVYENNWNRDYGSGYTPLHYAVEHKHFKILKMLLSASADASIDATDSDTPILFAAKYMDSTFKQKTIDILLSYPSLRAKEQPEFSLKHLCLEQYMNWLLKDLENNLPESSENLLTFIEGMETTDLYNQSIEFLKNKLNKNIFPKIGEITRNKIVLDCCNKQLIRAQKLLAHTDDNLQNVIAYLENDEQSKHIMEKCKTIRDTKTFHLLPENIQQYFSINIIKSLAKAYL